MRGRVRLAAAAAGALVILSSGRLAALDKPRIAVMPLRPQRVDADIVKILDSILVTHLGSLTQYDVIGTDEIAAILEMEGMKDSLGCSDVSCAAEIGGALDAQLTLVGSVGKLGDNVIINLTLFDNRSMKVKHRASVKVQNDENLFDHGVLSAVAKVFGETPPALPQALAAPASVADAQPGPMAFAGRPGLAGLTVVSTPNGAYVFLDAKPLGKTPLAQDIPPGSHNLAVEMRGYGAYSLTFSVNQGETSKRNIVLTSFEKAAAQRRTRLVLGWATTAISIGAGVAGIVLIRNTFAVITDTESNMTGGGIGKLYGGLMLAVLGLTTGLPIGIALLVTAPDLPRKPRYLKALEDDTTTASAQHANGAVLTFNTTF
ncbi:MAG: PEGA domain-containing protein [Myxococcota bacterium]